MKHVCASVIFSQINRSNAVQTVWVHWMCVSEFYYHELYYYTVQIGHTSFFFFTGFLLFPLLSTSLENLLLFHYHLLFLFSPGSLSVLGLIRKKWKGHSERADRNCVQLCMSRTFSSLFHLCLKNPANILDWHTILYKQPRENLTLKEITWLFL